MLQIIFRVTSLLIIFATTINFSLAQESSEDDKAVIKIGLTKSILPVGFTSDNLRWNWDYHWSGFLPSITVEKEKTRMGIGLTAFAWGSGSQSYGDSVFGHGRYHDFGIEGFHETSPSKQTAMTRYHIGVAMKMKYYNSSMFGTALNQYPGMDSIGVQEYYEKLSMTVLLSQTLEAEVSKKVSVFARVGVPFMSFGIGSDETLQFDYDSHEILEDSPGKSGFMDYELFGGEPTIMLGANIKI